jgi:hypothetical protein
MEKVMTTLIVGGCSYTDKDYKPYHDHNIKTWPSFLQEHYGYENMVNTASGGYGNRNIVNSVIDSILDHEMKDEVVVCVAWSEPYRLSFIDDPDLDHPVFLFSDEEYERRLTFSDKLAGYFKFIEDGRKELIKYIVRRQKKIGSSDPLQKMIDLNSKVIIQSYRNKFYLQDFCYNRDIPLFHMNTFDPFAFDRQLSSELYMPNNKEAQQKAADAAIEIIRESQYFKKVEKDIGYMGHKYNLYNDLSSHGYFIDDNGKINRHPNQEGHKFISERFREFIDLGDRLYNHTESSYRDVLYLWE